MEDHRVAALELREFSKDPCLVLELVVGKGSSNDDVFSQPIVLFDSMSAWRFRLQHVLARLGGQPTSDG